MTKSLLKLVLLLSALGIGLFMYVSYSGAPEWMLPGQTKPVVAAVAPSVVAPSPSLRQLRAKLRDDVHIPPDRRFLLALSTLRKLAGVAAEDQSPRVEFDGKQWVIGWADGESLTMPELTDFAAAMAGIRNMAGRSLPRLNLTANGVMPQERPLRFDASALWSRLGELDTEWQSSGRSSATLVRAAQAMAHLSLMSIDTLDIADGIQGKALAWLALAQVATNEPLAEAESQIAVSMQYRSHALNLARQLDDTQAWRLYLEQRDEELARSVAALGVNERDSYLLLRRLAEKNDMTAWFNTLRRQDKDVDELYPQLATSLAATKFFPRNVVSANLHYLILTYLVKHQEGKPSAMPPLPVWGKLFEANAYLRLREHFGRGDQLIFENFESWLTVLAKRHNGPLLDADLYRDFHRGYFYSALQHHAEFLLKTRASVTEARDFVDSLGQVEHGTGKEFRVWFDQLVRLEEGQSNSAELLAQLQTPSELGLTAWQETWTAYQGRLPFASPEAEKALRLLLPRLDSRIPHRLVLGDMLRNARFDMAGGEEVYRSVLRDDPQGQRPLAVWLASYQGDDAGLMVFADDPGRSPGQRSLALELVANRQERRGLIDTAYRRLLVDAPESWRAAHSYANFLGEGAQYAKQIDVLDAWLMGNYEAHPLNRLMAQSMIAEARLQEGKPEAAWKILAGSLDSWYGPTLAAAAKVRVAMGDYESAEKIARDAQGRYPTSIIPVSDLADVYWAAGRNDQAAAVLKARPQPISAEDWRWKIGKRFAERFAGKPAEAETAFAELVKAAISPFSLREMAVAVANDGQPEAAFRMQTQLRVRGMANADIQLSAYGYLEAWQGATSAEKWLREQISPKMQNAMSAHYMLERSRYPLLWSLIPAPEAGGHPDVVWLYRAAAKVDGAVLTPEQDMALEDYYARKPADFYGRLGLYLLGKLDEVTLLDAPLSATQRCEAAFYLGLRAQAERRYADAADWYLTSVSTGLRNNGEYLWSFNRLYRWRNLAKSLDFLAKNGR